MNRLSHLAGFILAALIAGLLASPLFAQPQILPPVEIGSETQVKAPIAKKLLDFPNEAPPDSIPPFGPWSQSLRHESQALRKGRISPLHLDLGMDSTVGTSLRASLYPNWKFLPLLGLDARLAAPGRTRFQTGFGGDLVTNVSKHVILAHSLDFSSAKADSLSSKLLSYALDNRIRSLRLGQVRLENLRTRLTLNRFDQDLGAVPDSYFAFGLDHNHEVSWRGNTLSNEFVVQDDAFGLSVKYQIPLKGSKAPELNVGLMTDLCRLLPAVEIHKRFVFKPDFLLDLSNRPGLRAWDCRTLQNLYPWSALDVKEQLTLSPWDFHLQAWRAWQDKNFVQALGFSHNSSYLFNQPQLSVMDPNGQTKVDYPDLMRNVSSLELRLLAFGLAINQNVQLNLEHLPDSDWIRKPYSPLLIATTSTETKLGDLTLSASLNQQYYTCDETGRFLPDVVDLSLAVAYSVNSDLSISASLSNIFNTPYHELGSLPEQGRTLKISFKYLPLR